jgi:AcrR family transcriptional regulator
MAWKATNEKYSLRQDKILSYAALVIAREGYEKASIRTIAKEMGMSISALYYYFGSKEDLLFSIQHTSFADLLQKLEARLEETSNPDQRLYLLIENHLEHFLSRLNELTICSHEINTLKGDPYKKVLELRRRYFEDALTIVEGIQEKAGSQLDARQATFNLFGMLNWIYMWFDPKKSQAPQALAREIHSLFMNGMNAKGPAPAGPAGAS